MLNESDQSRKFDQQNNFDREVEVSDFSEQFFSKSYYLRYYKLRFKSAIKLFVLSREQGFEHYPERMVKVMSTRSYLSRSTEALDYIINNRLKTRRNRVVKSGELVRLVGKSNYSSFLVSKLSS